MFSVFFRRLTIFLLLAQLVLGPVAPALAEEISVNTILSDQQNGNGDTMPVSGSSTPSADTFFDINAPAFFDGKPTLVEDKFFKPDGNLPVSPDTAPVDGMDVGGLFDPASTTPAVLGEKISAPTVENNSTIDPPLLKYTNVDLASIDGHPTQIYNDYIDVADLGQGQAVWRIHKNRRLVAPDESGKLQLRPQGWNLFHENKSSQLTKNTNSGYGYEVPFGDSHILVGAGDIETADSRVVAQPLGADFSQTVAEDQSVVSTYQNIYPNVDVVFKDFAGKRSRSIVLQKPIQPEDTAQDIVLVEKYTLPAEATIIDSQKEEIKDGAETYGPIYIHLDTNYFIIGESIIFDASGNERNSFPLRYVVRRDGQNVSLGIKVSAAILNNTQLVYPLTVDPVYEICKEGGSTFSWACVKQMDYYTTTPAPESRQPYAYSSALKSYDLAVGMDAIPPPVATREMLIKVDTDYPSISNLGTVNGATLKMYYNKGRTGNGNYTGDITLNARQITTNWSSDSVTYSAIKGNLNTLSSRVVNYPNTASGWVSWDIKNAVTGWAASPGSNYGVLVEPDPPWTKGANPAWPNRILFFKAAEDASQTGPYIDITITYSDLSVTVQSMSQSSYNPGNSGFANIRVWNNSNGDDKVATNLKYYFNPQSTCNSTSGSAIGSFALPGIAAQSSAPLSPSFVIPAGTSPGTYCLTFFVDQLGYVTESNENNNVTSVQITVNAAPVPDLVFSSAPTIDKNNIPAGTQIIATAPVSNVGNATSAATELVYKLDGAEIGRAAVPTLNASEQTTIVKTLTVPGGTAVGNHPLDISLVAVTGETNTANNIAPTINVAVVGVPNIVLSNFTISDTSLHFSGVNQSINVTGNIQNTGTAATSTAKYQMFLKSGSNQYQLTAVSPASLNLPTNSNQNVTLSGTIPAGMPYSGTYQIYIVFTGANILSSNTVSVQQYYYSGGGGGGPTPDTDADGVNDVAEIVCGTKVTATDRTKCYSSFPAPYTSKKADVENKGGDPVNLRNGALEFAATDFSVDNGPAFPLNFTRTYNSKLFDRNARLGRGWSHSYNIYYYQDPATKNVQVYLGGALATVFTTSDGGATFALSPGETETLARENGFLVYRTQTGISYLFSNDTINNIGQVQEIKDTNGRRLVFAYTNPTTTRGVPLLSSVTDPSGRSLSFVYPTDMTAFTWGSIQEVHESLSGADRLVARYEYQATSADAVDLIRVTKFTYYNSAVQSAITDYTYDASGKMTTFLGARGTMLYNDYDVDGRVLKQYEKNPRLGANDKRLLYEFAYDDDGDPVIAGSTHCTVLTNYRAASDAYTEKLCFNSAELRSYKEQGNVIERWTYDANGLVSSYTDGAGSVTSYTYDVKRRLVQTTPADADGWHTVITATYEDQFNRLISQTETATKSGNATLARTLTRSYDVRGNMLTATDYLGKTETFTYDASGNPVSYVDRNGQSTLYTFNSNGYRTREELTTTQANGSPQTIVKQYGYDGYGRVSSYTDPRAAIYLYSYDSQGNKRLETNPGGTTKQFTYDAEGHKLSDTNELGQVTNYVYDTDLNSSLTSVTNVSVNGNRVNSRANNWLGNVILETNPLGRQTISTYDNANRLLTTTDPLGNLTAYSYYQSGKLKTVTNSLGQKTEYIYDARGHKSEERHYTGATVFVSSLFKYDGLNRLTQTTDPNGNITTFAYDLNDRLTQKIDALAGVSVYRYDANGNKTGEKSPRVSAGAVVQNQAGDSNTYVYDGVNRLIKTIDALNKVTSYTYDANGNLISSIDRANADGSSTTHITSSVYDTRNRKTSETFADGSSLVYSYDSVGNVLTKRDQSGRTDTYVYDDLNRLISETDNGGAVTGYQYDLSGNKTRLIYPDTTIASYTYDAGNRLSSITDALGNTQTITYDIVGNKITSTDKLGRVTRFTYDLLNRLVTEINPAGTTLVYTYDNNGNRLSETVGQKVTTYTYDALNRPTGQSFSATETESYNYDVDGNRISYTDGKGQVTTYDYSSPTGFNWVTAKHLPNSFVVRYTYDNWGNTLSIVDENGTTSATYDAMNRPLSETRSFGAVGSVTSNRAYAADGQLSSLTDGAGRTFNYTYNNRGLLNNVVLSTTTLARYTYSPLGLPATITYGNGVVTTINYDGLNRVQNIEDKNSAGTSLWRQDYTYDAASNRTSLIENGTRTTAYDYDALEQLTGVRIDVGGSDEEFLSYQYDAVGNRLVAGSSYGTSTYTYNAANNTLATVNVNNGNLTTAVTFDKNGSLMSETISRLGQADKTVNYSWDGQNRLVNIAYASSNRPAELGVASAETLLFAYDDAGNRVQKSANGDSTYYLNDGLSVLNELDATLTPTKSVVRGLGQIAEIDMSGTITYVHQDVLGSAVLLTDATGAVVQQYEYDPFGALVGSDGGADTKYTYTGQEYDVESELFYYNARYYNPALGRFISRDPLGGRAGDLLSRNGYIYVKNNPFKYTDPTGMEEKKLVVEEKWWQNQALNNTLETMDNVLTFILDIPTFGGITRSKEIGEAASKEGWTTKNFALFLGNTLISAAAGTLSALDVGVAMGAAVVNGTASLGQEFSTIYRVEGVQNTKVLIGEGGSVKLNVTSGCFYVNCGPLETSLDYFTKKTARGGLENLQIKAFDVNSSFVEKLQSEAVNQAEHPYFPNTPMRVDLTTGADQFGLFRDQIKQLNENIIQGSGRIINPF